MERKTGARGERAPVVRRYFVPLRLKRMIIAKTKALALMAAKPAHAVWELAVAPVTVSTGVV